MLGLRPGQRLLDVGAGQGWPGLYLAHETGCTAIVTDVPFDRLSAASRRADRDGIAKRAWAIVAGSDRLPLRPASVDAVIYTDVLCCLRPKLATLRATRAVLRPGGRTVFSVISPPRDCPTPRRDAPSRPARPSARCTPPTRTCRGRPASSTSTSTTSHPTTSRQPDGSSRSPSGLRPAWQGARPPGVRGHPGKAPTRHRRHRGRAAPALGVRRPPCSRADRQRESGRSSVVLRGRRPLACWAGTGAGCHRRLASTPSAPTGERRR
ncbi:MAG: class I SAM-dependent methyltransferase [Acidimicrobiales bacterium]